MKSNVSLFSFIGISICSIWFYVQALIFKFFNGQTTFYQIIAYELDHKPFFRYGILLMYILTLLFFFIESKKPWKKSKISFFMVSSILVLPLYTHILINEYTMEIKSVNLESLKETRLEYSVVEAVSYDHVTKEIKVILNYGRKSKHISERYFNNDRPMTDSLERQIKRGLHNDMNQIIQSVWTKSHNPKQIKFEVKWGKEVLLTTTAKKREHYLSYLDNDENDNFISIYYHLDVVKENGKYVLKLKGDNGKWITVIE